MQGLQAFIWLMRRDFILIYRNWYNSLLDSILLPLSFIIIAGYIFPILGMPISYGALMVVGGSTFMCFCTAGWMCAAPLIADLEGERSISYELTLPIPSWLVCIQKGCSFALKASLLNCLTLVLGKIVLWNRFDLTHFSLPKFVLAYLLTNILFGFIAVTLCFWLATTQNFFRFWLRVCAQLVMFSGFQFAWSTLYQASPTLAYIDLVNPLVYGFEAVRAAVMGQAGNINYRVCIAAILGWTAVFICTSIHCFKRELDSV